MNFNNVVSKAFARIRYRCFRLLSIIFLGRDVGESLIGQCISSDLEFANTERVRNRILERKLVSGAALQSYALTNVPECWQIMFSRTAVFPRRYAYLLSDVAIGPDSGVVFAPPTKLFGGDGIIFIQSACHHYFFCQCGIQEVMRRARTIDEKLPVCPMPTIGYYHELLEGLLRVWLARKIFGDIRVLVPAKRSKYIDEMLAFIGVAKDQILYSDCPVRVKAGILIPRWSDCGENLKEDVCAFRDYLVSRLIGDCNGAAKLYISRAKSRRSLPDEREIERVLVSNGFRIVYFEEMSFVEQLKAIRSADIIVSPHGAGLSNLIVAKPRTKVIEIMTQGWANSCYGHLASSLGLDYYCVDADDNQMFEKIG